MKYLLILLSFFFIEYSFSQSFPTSWIGHYEGNLEIYGVDSVLRTIKMNLDIEKTLNDSIFVWQITYQLDSTADIRKYELHVLDQEKGLFQIDEKNGIVIESYLKSDILTSFFSVMNNFIIATYAKMDDYIDFEIIVANTKPVSTTGETKHEKEEIPKVETYPVQGRQKARLYRQ